MNTKLILMAIIGSTLAGCATVPSATAEKFEARVQTHMGESINDMILRAGPPQGTYRMPNGMTVYQFERHSGPIMHTMYTSFGPITTSNSWSCRVDYIADKKQIVRSYRIEGNACVSE